MWLLDRWLALVVALLWCSSTVCARHSRPLDTLATLERPVLYNTTTYGILELDFVIQVEMVGARRCNTTAVADGVVKGEHYAPIFDGCGVEGQLTLTSSAVVNASIPLVRLDLTWADSYTSDAHTYDCAILWDPTATVAAPSCEVAYNHGENFYSATFLVASWGGYVLPQLDLGFNVSVVISQDSAVQCSGWDVVEPFDSSKPMGLEGTKVTVDLGDCDSGSLFYTIYFNTSDLSRYAVQPNWSQSVVLAGTSQSCFFVLQQPPSPEAIDEDASCNDSVYWDSVTYEWTFQIASSSKPLAL